MMKIITWNIKDSMEDPNRGFSETVYVQKIQMFSCYKRQNVLEQKHKLSSTVVGEDVTPSTLTPLAHLED
jgi:hypothetical protein